MSGGGGSVPVRVRMESCELWFGTADQTAVTAPPALGCVRHFLKTQALMWGAETPPVLCGASLVVAFFPPEQSLTF